jgi:hypothetical protein
MQIYENENKKSDFTPFEIVIKVQNKDELLDLLGRANQTFDQVKEGLECYRCDFDSKNVDNMTFYYFIKNKVLELNLIKG